jgi:hypothetical protein
MDEAVAGDERILFDFINMFFLLTSEPIEALIFPIHVSRSPFDGISQEKQYYMMNNVCIVDKVGSVAKSSHRLRG